MSIERPKEHAPEGSTNHYTNQLHQKRHSYQSKGMLLLLPRTGLIVVPYDVHHWGWTCVIVHCPKDLQKSYPVGGHNIDIGDDEIETATQLFVSLTLP